MNRPDWTVKILSVFFGLTTMVACFRQEAGAPVVATKVSQPDNATKAAENLAGLTHPEFSVPTYGLILRSKPESVLHEIDRSIGKNIQMGQPEVQAVCAAGREWGVPLSLVLLDARRPERIPVPCLLVVSLSGRRGHDGSLVLVEARGDDQLQVYDFQGGKGRSYLHFSDLPIIWNGDAIVMDREHVSGWSWMVMIGGITILGLGILLLWWSSRIRSAHAKLAVALLAVCVIGITGCDGNTVRKVPAGGNVSSSPVVATGGAVIDLGVLKGDANKQYKFSIPMRGEHDGPIRIDRVLGNCTCLSLGEKVIGTQVGQGEAFELDGTLRLDGKIGETLLVLQIQSSNLKGEELPVSKVGLRFVVDPSPVVNSNKLELQAFESESSWRGKLSLILHRLKEHPKLELDRSGCMTGGLNMEVSATQIGVNMEGSEVVRDLLELEFSQLRGAESPLPHSIRLTCEDYGQAIDLPVEASLLPAVTCEPASLFLGMVSAESKITKSVLLVDQTGRGPALEPVTLESGCAAAKIVAVHSSPSGTMVQLDFMPVGPAGRGEGTLLMKAGEANRIEVPVSWVIR